MTAQTEVSALSDTELRDNLVTLDWRGREFKQAALDELIDRAIRATTLALNRQHDADCAEWDGGRQV